MKYEIKTTNLFGEISTLSTHENRAEAYFIAKMHTLKDKNVKLFGVKYWVEEVE